MKKLLSCSLVIIMIFLIYWAFKDRKVYYLALGDELTLGITDEEILTQGYSLLIKQKFEEKDKLEMYVNQFVKPGNRITDVINDINNNIYVKHDNKKITIKNALIKADLVTLSINSGEFIKKIENDTNLVEAYSWIDELSEDYEYLLGLLRDYCKEEIAVVGFYLPKTMEANSDKLKLATYINERFSNISNQYNVKFINILATFLENDYLLTERYPNKDGYKVIGEYIITEIPEIQ